MKLQELEQRNKELEKEMKQERTKQEREFEVTISCKEQTKQQHLKA